MPEFRDTWDRVRPVPRTPGPRGRPRALTPALADALVDAVRAGASVRVACAIAGVGRSTVYRDAALVARLDRAAVAIEIDMVTRLRTAARKPRGWRAAAWFLSHRHPDRWGKGRKAREQQPTGDPPPTLKLPTLAGFSNALRSNPRSRAVVLEAIALAREQAASPGPQTQVGPTSPTSEQTP